MIFIIQGGYMKTHLIMPMGGAGSRFYKNGYMQPKPLIEINGKPFLYWATMSIKRFVDVADITFVVLKEHIDEFAIDKTIIDYFPDAHIEVLERILPGPVFTSIEGVKHITDDFPILFNDCDHMFKCSKINEILNSDSFELDGALLTFKSYEPQFSYVRYDREKNIIGTVEKEVVSNHAICGAYIFRNVSLFKSIADEYVKNCPYDECFMSGMYTVMCEHKMALRDYLLDFHVEFGTPEEYELAKESEYFNKFE